MAEKIRWGIIGTGAIAKKFATGLQAAPDATLAAVGSRTQEKAEAFGAQFNVPRRHGSYEALAADAEVDAVYVATPHPFHAENSIMCLEAGKAVLCEKPFAINAKEAKRVIETARRCKRFLMEAMWTRFFPVMAKAREWMKAGKIGEPRMVVADFGFRAGVNPEGRLFKAALGGGALLDVGIYPISFASMVFGRQPEKISSAANIGTTGVDEQSAMLFQYEGGAMALLYTAVRLSTPQAALVLGTEGRIEIPPEFWKPKELTLVAGSTRERLELPVRGNGYECEAEEVGRCLREGKCESEVMPLDETLAIMKTMDRVRKQWGLKYPME